MRRQTLLHPRPRRDPAFTLIELLVAISITSLMLFLVNRIFNDTNRAVSRGIELSEVISQERAVQTHLQNDAAAMMGPQGGPGEAATAGNTGNGGPLVIVQHRVDGRTFELPGTPINDNNADGDNNPATRSVRTDQLMFVRQRGTELPVAPSSTTGFTAGSVDANTPYARVIYGHVLRTNDNGSDPGLNLDFDDPTDTIAFLDRRPTSWILGRQALFLQNGTSTYAGIEAEDGTIDGAVKGYGTGANAPAWAGTYPSSRPPLYMGLADVAEFSLREADAALPSPSTSSFDSMIGDTTGAPNGTTTRLVSTLSTADYQDRAVTFYTFARTRLRTNDRPPSEDYKSWEIAQTHPILAEGVSDFIVEFAADVDADGAIDRVSTDESSDLFGNESFTGTIKWYTHDDYVNRPDPSGSASGLPASPGTAAYDNRQPLTFELPAGTYRTDVYEDDIDTAFAPTTFPAGTAAFVWRHDRFNPDAVVGSPPNDPYCDWPYLLRVRYRMHDPTGDLASGDGQHGVWFEQVLKVNRPYPTP